MTTRKGIWIPVFFALCIISSAAIAQSLSNSDRTSITPTTIDPLDYGQIATDAALEADELEQYDTLIRGLAGLQYRHMHPYFVLGVYAKTDQERTKYARKLALYERQRLNQLFDFNREFRAAVEDLGEPAIDISSYRSFLDEKSNTLTYQTPVNPASPKVFLVRTDCTECSKLISNNIKGPMDLFFIGATDADIRAYAATIPIPPELVSSRTITLNHAPSQLSTMDVPAQFNGSQWTTLNTER